MIRQYFDEEGTIYDNEPKRWINPRRTPPLTYHGVRDALPPFKNADVILKEKIAMLEKDPRTIEFEDLDESKTSEELNQELTRALEALI